MDSSSEDDVRMVAITGLLLRRRLRRRRRRMWIRPLLQMRTRQGAFHNLIKEMRLSDPKKHFNFFRMTRETFSPPVYQPCLRT